MNNVLFVLIIILTIILAIIGIETIIFIKKSEGKLIDDIRKKLLVRIDILMVLTVIMGIMTIVKILMNH